MKQLSFWTFALALLLIPNGAQCKRTSAQLFYDYAIESLLDAADHQAEAKQAGPLHQTLLRLYNLKALGDSASRAELEEALKTKNPLGLTEADFRYFASNELSGRELQPYEVVLTFDDGPHETRTLEVASILKHWGAPGAFFQVGEEGVKFPGHTQSLRDLGFLVANHSVSHKNLTKMDEPEIRSQIEGVQQFLNQTLGGPGFWNDQFQLFFAALFPHQLRKIVANEFFRAPYGARSRRVLDIIKSYPVGESCQNQICAISKLNHVVWLVDSLDWADKNPESIEKRVFSQLDSFKNRGIILFHDIHAQTVLAIERIIPRLIKDGYKIVTLYDALAAQERTIRRHQLQIQPK
ncbi:MAG: polysaccharide deacetylase family protein [Oligoflexia bacterium]|nr:polysaccharide deacetylase family protein [Oligoflexia bacterium]